MYPHSIFKKNDYEKILERIEKLSSGSVADWGKMNVGQMLAHLSLPVEVSLGKMKPAKKPGFLMRLLLKPLILSKKPWKPNLPTGKDFIVSGSKDFLEEKARLLLNLKDAYETGESGEWNIHPALGKLKPVEQGWLIWKHCDHHLRQFGV